MVYLEHKTKGMLLVGLSCLVSCGQQRRSTQLHHTQQQYRSEQAEQTLLQEQRQEQRDTHEEEALLLTALLEHFPSDSNTRGSKQRLQLALHRERRQHQQDSSQRQGSLREHTQQRSQLETQGLLQRSELHSQQLQLSPWSLGRSSLLGLLLLVSAGLATYYLIQREGGLRWN